MAVAKYWGGMSWKKVQDSVGVKSINGETGIVELDKDDIIGLSDALNGKASVSHTHSESQITGLAEDLASKASATHTHTQSDITGLVTALSAKADTSSVTQLSNNKADKTDIPTVDLSKGEVIPRELNNITQLSSDIAELQTEKADKTELPSTAEKAAWNGKQDALTAGENITIVGNVISATGGGSVEREWTLVGTIAGTADNRGNIATGLTDVGSVLAGCTELYIYGWAEPTGNCSLQANFGSLLYNGFGTSKKSVSAHFVDTVAGFMCNNAVYAGTTNPSAMTSATSGTTRIDGTHLADATSFSLSAPTAITSCSIKIYAR